MSLVVLLQEWFESYSNVHLWPLVERALADERLLLLVDGLDEWRDEGAARIALQLLHVFIGQRNTPAVLVGRPQGLNALGPFPPGYREAVLAPLDRPQQRAIVERLLNARESAATQADAFFRELDQLPALRAIAGVPLLLGLLLRQHLEHARLPVSRFRVGERMVETLLRDHPIRRQQAVLVCATPLLAERELKEAFAYVAWRTHTERPEGLVENDTLREWLVTFFADAEHGLGYSRPEARSLGDEFLRHGEREFGVIVERAPGWSGFAHRTIQELLAAEYFGTIDRPTQFVLLREHAAQSHWREVMLAWCHRRSPPDFAEIVTTLEELTEISDLVARHRITEFLAELATGDFGLPTSLARRLTDRLVNTVWVCEWPRHRRRLLELALDGLHGGHAVRSIVQNAVRAWFPGRLGASYRLASRMAKWPSSSDLIEALIRTLHHEEESAQRAAADALGFFASSDPAVADRLAHLAETSIRATTRACALEALGRGQIDDPRLLDITERERRSGSGEIAITAITIRIRKKLQTHDDLRTLLRCAGRRPFRVDYSWRPDLIEALLNGWPRSAEAKAAVIKSIIRDRPLDDGMEHEIAFPILIRGFSGDEDAALALVKFFQRSHAFIHLEYDAQRWLPGNARWFAEHPAVSRAVESYLFRDAHRDPYRFAQAALLTRTPRVKAHLLDAFRQSKSFGHWPAWALLEGWGTEDPEVATVLRETLNSQPESIAAMGDLIPRIFPEGDEARCKLLRCLDANEAEWPWHLLSGFVAVDGNLRSPDVLESCLRLMERAPNWQRKHIRRYLIEHAAPDARVRELALAELDDHDGELTAVAEGFGHDAAIRSRLIAVMVPLPAELRAIVVDRLAALPLDDAFAREMLAQFDLERDGEVKARAAVASVRRQQASGSLDPACVPGLRKMLHAVGLDNEERHEAAGAALLELREFNAIREEFSGRFSAGQRLFGESLRHSRETISRQLARHWSELEGTLGKEAFAEFTYHDERLSFANRLAQFVEDAQGARAWLQSLFFAVERDGIPFGLLEFLAQTEPGSERLLTFCIGVLHGRVKTPLYGWADQMQTAALFAAHWKGDGEALAQLTVGFAPHQLPEPVVIALTLGWPDSGELASYYETAAREKRLVSSSVGHALGATFSPPDRFAELIARFALNRGGKESHVFREAVRCYAARAHRDGEARQALLSMLGNAESPDVRVTLAGLLAHAVPGWSNFREWRDLEVANSNATFIRAEFGYNLATSNVESLFALLVED